MNRWRQQFDEHPLHTELEQINALLSSASLKTDDASIIEPFDRLIIVLKTFNYFVECLNPECTTNAYLDKLNGVVSQLRPQLEQFLKDENPVHLKSANTQADQLTQHMPPFALPEIAAKQASAVGDLVVAAEGLIVSLSDKSKSVSGDLEKLKTESQATSQKLAQLDQTIESQKARLDTAVADFQKQFSETEAARRTKAEQSEENFKTQFEQLKNKVSEDIAALKTAQTEELEQLSIELKATAQQILADMESKKDAAAKVLNVSTNVAVSGGYGKYASQEKIAAEIFRGIALIFMICLIVGAYKTIAVALKIDAIDWRLLSIRTITTFTLAIPAFYAVKESGKHRLAERRYRKMQLELAAIDPYLELLDKEKREGIKVDLSKRFFAQPEVVSAADDVDAGSLLDIIRNVINALLKK